MRIVLLYILLLMVGSVTGQDFVKITCDKASVQMGESFTVNYTIYGDSSFSRAIYLEDPDTIVAAEKLLGEQDDPSIVYDELSDFDIEDYGQWKIIDDIYIDSSSLAINKVGNRYISKNTVKMTAWYPGKFRIPSLYTEGDSSYLIDHSNTPILVMPPASLLEKDSLKLDETADIRDIIREPVSWRDYFYIIIPLASILIIGLLALLFIYMRKRFSKEQEIEEVKVIIPAHVIALEKLDGLKESKPWQTGQVKEYQSSLTYIIREYLENRFEIDALESSTKEIKADLADTKLAPDLVSNLTNILQIADLVKFAKANPSGDIHETFLHQAYDFIQGTKQEVVPDLTNQNEVS